LRPVQRRETNMSTYHYHVMIAEEAPGYDPEEVEV
jgi:hypothetical protein